MFVWTLKMSKREIIIFISGLAAFVAIVCLLLMPGDNARTSAELTPSERTVEAANAAERAAFIRQFGWDIAADPAAVKEIIIPPEFDDLYIAYNELQKAQGFDLEPLRGEKVTLWTYAVLNYPGQEKGVVANILIKGGKVVGGDVSSTALDGFMVGFDPNQSALQTAAAQLNGFEIDRSLPASIPANSDIPPETDG